MRLRFLLLASVLISCAGIPKRPIEFSPPSINTPEQPRVYACFQDGKTDKLNCMDFQAFLQFLAKRQQELEERQNVGTQDM